MLDIEESGVRLRLTVVDTPGFGDFVNNDEWYGITDAQSSHHVLICSAQLEAHR